MPRFLRRLLVLALFGVVHALFFYAADVLLIYALTALALIPWRRARGRTLAKVGVALVAVTVAWGAFISGPDSPDLADRQRAAVESVARARESGLLTLPDQELRHPARIDLSRYPDWEPSEGGRVRIPAKTYEQPLDAEPAIFFLDDGDEAVESLVEYSVYSRGPVAAAFLDRLLFLAALILLYLPAYLFWRTLGLFLLGAAVVVAGGLGTRSSIAWRRVRNWGFALGLPVTVVASAVRLRTFESQSDWVYLGDVLHDVSSLPLAVGLAGAVFTWVTAALRTPIQRSLAAVGRTALSNYIGQSVVMAILATSYGFGLFGDLGRMSLLALAIGCFGLQMLVSSWWMRRFRAGPLEWIWRCCTYWRLLPLKRRADA